MVLQVILRRILLHAQEFVIILPFRFLEFEFRVVDIPLDARFLRVGLVDGFVFAHGVFPGPGFAEGAGPGFACFEVAGIEGEGAVTVGDGGFVVFQLW